MSSIDHPGLHQVVNIDELARKMKARSLASQRIQIYIPNKDQYGREILDIDMWIDEAVRIFKIVNGGATAIRGLQGAWVDPDDNNCSVDETTTIVYSFISNSSEFRAGIGRISAFVARFGHHTYQREVLVEYEGHAMWIDDFSSAVT